MHNNDMNNYTSGNQKNNYYKFLKSSVDQCNLSPRLCSRKKVFSLLNGKLHSKVVFIAEAPGRLGAECTGIPLYGDKTGDTFVKHC